jgi:hypothetical protein
MMIWKGCGRKRLWLTFKALSWHLPRGTEENHKNLSHNSQSLGSDLNLEPQEYEV